MQLAATLRTTLLATLTPGLFACSTFRPSPRPIPSASGRIITAETIEKTGARTAWEAMQQTVKYIIFDETSRGQPDRIRRRGASSLLLFEDMPVFLDDIRIIDILDLDKIPAAQIARIRVLNGIDATTYYGTGAGDGVILIYTKT
jgi:outer membrane receptor for ferrienterochelin and colicin